MIARLYLVRADDLTAVIGIDADIVMRQITGPAGPGFITCAQIYIDSNFMRLHDLLPDFIGVAGSGLTGFHYRHLILRITQCQRESV